MRAPFRQRFETIEERRGKQSQPAKDQGTFSRKDN
jgi:hypothetical protein